MSDYEIITDASADMAAGAREKYGIKVIPMLYLQNGEEKIADGTESEEYRAAFYEAERQGAEVKSTQINPATYEEKFEPYLKEGKTYYISAYRAGFPRRTPLLWLRRNN